MFILAVLFIMNVAEMDNNMCFDPEQFEALINYSIKTGFPDDIDPAETLLMGTCAVESNFGSYLRQINGPAIGVFQMEPVTFDWLKSKYEDRFIWLHGRKHDEMWFDLMLSIRMARLRYLVVPEPIPNSSDIYGLAKYWKAHYNTMRGGGSIFDFVEKYNRYCER